MVGHHSRGAMNANQLNKFFRPLGVVIRQGEGYYYWLSAKTGDCVLDAQSVPVYRASHLSFDKWMDLAKEAAKCL